MLRYSQKEPKVESLTNGEPVHLEVRTTLKSHRPLLCVESIFANENNMRSSFCSKLKLLWALIFTSNLICFENTVPSASVTIFYLISLFNLFYFLYVISIRQLRLHLDSQESLDLIRTDLELNCNFFGVGWSEIGHTCFVKTEGKNKHYVKELKT